MDPVRDGWLRVTTEAPIKACILVMMCRFAAGD